MLSTLLLPQAAADPVLSSQIISLLGGHCGSALLQTEVAISASAPLVFASKTAILGSYHVFLALARMEFFPQMILKRNTSRGTPHYSIALATVVPILVLVAVRGNINILGDMYAFGLLGAFSLTCLGWILCAIAHASTGVCRHWNLHRTLAHALASIKISPQHQPTLKKTLKIQPL